MDGGLQDVLLWGRPAVWGWGMNLKETIEQYLTEHGYTKRTTDFGLDLWTHPDWKGWWRNPRTGEESDREHPLDIMIGQVILNESEAWGGAK